MARKKTTKEATTPTETAKVETATPALSVENIRAATKIIAIAAQRGAFKAEEMTPVGATFDKLAAFVSSYDAKIAAEKAEQGEKNE